MSSFENLRIVDNFYQTSLFFPMPTVVISTLCEDGSTNLGPYSLVQPYYVAGKASLDSVRYAADRVDDKVKFTDDALETILGVPWVFLPTVLKGCVAWAKENNVELVTAEHMKIINDKRSKEKSRK